MKGNSRTTEAMLRLLSTQRLILFCFFMSMYVSLTSSKAIVSLELKRYTNPTHHQLNGECCEWVCWNFLDLGVCDNSISLCVDGIESVSDSMHVCPYYKMENSHEGDDDFYFPSTLGSNHHPNPIVFEVDNYTGGFRMKLDVWDEDFFLFGLNSDDHIDFYNEAIFITPSPSVNSASTQFQTLNGSGSSQTTIEVKAYCADNYYGINCSVYCLACDNDVDGHYTCDPSTGDKTCLAGYEGTLCKIDTNECESSPCQNGGTCRNYPNFFMCECAEGNSGEMCEIVLNKCHSNPCKNGATCVGSITTFSCECADGFDGDFCETEIDECQSNPCQNSGSCTDIVNGFLCDCVAGYSGLLCENDLDECASGPCSNGATCIDDVNRYNCSCTGGFKGDLCETEKDECESSPCQNSGTCQDMINGFQCNCTSGYYGLLCETDHDDCASNPCSNGATCTDALNGYVCTCAEGFFGIHCKGSYTILWISLPIAAVILIVAALTFILIRRHYVGSYNLISGIERESLLNHPILKTMKIGCLNSTSVDEESLECI